MRGQGRGSPSRRGCRPAHLLIADHFGSAEASPSLLLFVSLLKKEG